MSTAYVVKNSHMQHRPRKTSRQVPSFDIGKAGVLGKLDKSPKGSLDAPIAHLVHTINAHSQFVTTSSCSGRIVLFASGGGLCRGGRWLLVRHSTVTASDVSDALGRPEDASARDSEATTGPAAPQAADGAPEAAAGAHVATSTTLRVDELVTFKVEPGILHVMCRDVTAAKWLLQLALSNGFRESGLVLSGSAKTMLAIRTTANSIELPVADAGRQLLDPEYLRFLVDYANAKFEANIRKLDALLSAFERAALEEAHSAQAEECVPCNDNEAANIVDTLISYEVSPRSERENGSESRDVRDATFVPSERNKLGGSVDVRAGGSARDEVEVAACCGEDGDGTVGDASSEVILSEEFAHLQAGDVEGLRGANTQSATTSSNDGEAASLSTMLRHAVAPKTSCQVKHFVNLTNGLEALRGLIKDCGVPIAEVSQPTTVPVQLPLMTPECPKYPRNLTTAGIVRAYPVELL